jgi:hypothetical protein
VQLVAPFLQLVFHFLEDQAEDHRARAQLLY